MYPGLPSRLEKEMKQLYLTRVLGGDPTRLRVSLIDLPFASGAGMDVSDACFRISKSASKILRGESTWSSWEVLC